MNIPLTSVPNVPFYDSPYSPSQSGLAQGASKINHSVAGNLYPANSFDIHSNSKVYSFNGNDIKSNNLRNQVNDNVIINPYKESFTINQKIDNQEDYINYLKKRKYAKNVQFKTMLESFDEIKKHRIFKTSLPVSYISEKIYESLMENEFVREHSKIKSYTVKQFCDVLYDAYRESLEVYSRKYKTRDPYLYLPEILPLIDHYYNLILEKMFFPNNSRTNKSPKNYALTVTKLPEKNESVSGTLKPIKKESFTDPTHKAGEITAIIMIVIIVLLIIAYVIYELVRSKKNPGRKIFKTFRKN